MTLEVLSIAVALMLGEVAAEPLAFRARVEPESVELGRPFVYELVITHPKELRYELKLPGDLGPFESIDHTRSRLDGRDSATTTFRVQLALFELGEQRLPDLPFEVVGPGGSAVWHAPGRLVEGLSSLPANAKDQGADLFDIRPPEEVPVRTWRLLYGLAALVAAAAAGYLLYRWWKRPRPPPAAAPEPIVPLETRTLALLDSLRAENLPGQGRVREFHFRLSEIVRGYVGARYGFDALECTSQELLTKLGRLHTPGLKLDGFEAFSGRCDLVKFAKASVDAAECKEALEFGYRLVHETTFNLAPPTGSNVRAPAP